MSIPINTVMFPRGVPGSGKSSLSNLLKQLCETRNLQMKIHSTDAKFMVGGEYKFDFSKLGHYHKLNFDEYCRTLLDGKTNLVIVDNTNLVLRDFNHYVEYAIRMGFRTADVVFYPDLPERHQARNVHSVPLEAIERMQGKFKTALDFAHKRYEIFPQTFKVDVERVAQEIIDGI